MKRWRRDTSEGVVLVAVVCWSVEEAEMGTREGVRDLKARKEKRMMTIRASHIDIRNMVVREDR
jgi:hypothetical protein